VPLVRCITSGIFLAVTPRSPTDKSRRRVHGLEMLAPKGVDCLRINRNARPRASIGDGLIHLAFP